MKQFEEAKSIRCAVIGYGGAFNMGRAHLEGMQKAGMSPYAVAELDAERLEVAVKDFPGIQTYTSVEAMLKEGKPDLVTIITPHNTHAELAVQCLEAGAGVICEKPMAITIEECDQMIGTAKSNDLMLSVYHNRHWDGCILEAVDRIAEKKEIGEVFRVEAHMGTYGNFGDWWRSSRSISGGIHYDWGVHLLEYTLQLIDSEAIEVTAFQKEGFWETRWKDDTIQDEMSVIVRFANGAMLDLRITTLDANPDNGQLAITGTLGKYIFDQPNFELYRPNGNETQITKGKNRASEQDNYYQNIADAMTGKAELVITPELSRRTIVILEAATKSANEGRAVRLT